ncbi:MAG: Diaminopimelate decarboxylase [Syntrophus sp. SKADARSKE-3]|nr:Diaminopimelate decarboxylase [Syntrophus sp. SKADARSKE-3]
MNDFRYQSDELYCESVPVKDIAKQVGTPFYLYSRHTLSHHYRVFDKAFAAVPHIICYSVKSNSNIAILRLFIKEGGGVDIVSGGELFRAVQAGVDPQKVVYSGVGKRMDEIEYALKTGILMFNIESPQELELINQCAGQLNMKAGVALRINPDVDAETHAYISTGKKENKFGIDVNRSLEAYKRAMSLKNIDIKGVSCHIGSQLTKVSPFINALNNLKKLIAMLETEKIHIRYLDLGGGLGITYNEETPPHPDAYAMAIIEATHDLSCTFIFEPGRVIVGNAGILVTSVLYTKEGDAKNFFIVDAAMNDLIRPSLYQSYHHIQPVIIDKSRPDMVVDVVGPICESGDYLAKERRLQKFKQGELMAVMSAGAYGFSMSSNYNSRPRIPEIMIDGEKIHVIRKRETFEDIIRGEVIPEDF